MTAVWAGTNVAVYDPAPLALFPHSLYDHVTWEQSGGEARFLREDGVVVRPVNFPDPGEHGAITHEFCGEADDPLFGARPDIDNLDEFVHSSVWYAGKTDCGNIGSDDRLRALKRIRANFERLEPIDAETVFAARLLTDATPVAAADLADGIGLIEDLAAALGVGGLLIHARPYWISQALEGLIDDSLKTRLGSQFVTGGGYATTPGLGDVLVATTPVYGWRSETQVLESLEHTENQLYALVQRSVLLAYEKVVAAVDVS